MTGTFYAVQDAHIIPRATFATLARPTRLALTVSTITLSISGAYLVVFSITRKIITLAILSPNLL